MKVFIVGGGDAYRYLFRGYLDMEIVSDMTRAQLAVFTGGEDVTPRLYGETPHRMSFYNPNRDNKEQGFFAFFQAHKIPMVGICRGGQFLNVMNGGRMYQDVTGHTRDHDITDVQTGQVVYVTSTHHQMMRPGPKGEILAVSNFPTKREWMEGEVVARDESNTGIEVVIYRDTRSLCFQPHPEMCLNQVIYDPMRDYFACCLTKVLV